VEKEKIQGMVTKRILQEKKSSPRESSGEYKIQSQKSWGNCEEFKGYSGAGKTIEKTELETTKGQGLGLTRWNGCSSRLYFFI
jgi:hypothetical protein